MNVLGEEMESDLTYLCQMLKTGVGKDSTVNQKEWKQINHIAHPSSKPPRALIRTKTEETITMIDYF